MIYYALGLSTGLYAVMFVVLWALARWLEVLSPWHAQMLMTAQALGLLFGIFALLTLLGKAIARFDLKAPSAVPPQ